MDQLELAEWMIAALGARQDERGALRAAGVTVFFEDNQVNVEAVTASPARLVRWDAVFTDAPLAVVQAAVMFAAGEAQADMLPRD
jgi:hypothetical protein